jgi:hypothetical protein
MRPKIGGKEGDVFLSSMGLIAKRIFFSTSKMTPVD